MDSSSNFLGALDAKTNMTIVISNSNESLKPSSLTSSSLLLHRHDLQNFVLKGRSNEHINNFVFFDGQGEQIDLFQALNLAILHQTTKFGDWDPILFFLASTSKASAATSITTASTTSSPPTISKTSPETTAITGWSSIRHSLVEVNQAILAW